MDVILWKIYCQPLYAINSVIFIGLVFWIYTVIKIKNEILWRRMNTAFSIVVIFVILYVTLFSRSEVDRGNGFVFIPFIKILEIKVQPERLREIVMNIFLFFPLGLTLPFSFPEKTKNEIWRSCILGFLLSSYIEVNQYVFSLGQGEVDDIIFNTLGLAIGCTAYFFSMLIKHHKI